MTQHARRIARAVSALIIISCATGNAAPPISVNTNNSVRSDSTASSVNQPAPLRTATSASCAASPAGSRVSCYQALLTQTLKENGIGAAMTLLEKIDASDELVHENSHMLAHSVGLAAFTTPADLAKIFSQCSPNFQSGCYHGLIQAYFLAWQRGSNGRAIGADEIAGVCKDFHGHTGAWLLFQCVHGLGHGLELIYSHDLPRSLAGCDLIPDGWERSGCYGGAFMENVISVTSPHQMAENITESGGMEMSGMDHMDHSAMGAPAYKAYDPSDKLYPCSSLPDRYLPDCYSMQTSLILFGNHGDFKAAGAACERVPKAYLQLCFISLGRDANSYAETVPARAIELCSSTAAQFRPWCNVGVAKNTVDITSHPSDGFRYCEMLLDDYPSRATCHAAIGEEIRLLVSAPEKRRELCSVAPAPFEKACLYGAGVITERPAGVVPWR